MRKRILAVALVSIFSGLAYATSPTIEAIAPKTVLSGTTQPVFVVGTGFETGDLQATVDGRSVEVKVFGSTLACLECPDLDEGMYLVTITNTDGTSSTIIGVEPGLGVGDALVGLITLIDALARDGLITNRGVAQSATSRLRTAKSMLDSGDDNKAVIQLITSSAGVLQPGRFVSPALANVFHIFFGLILFPDAAARNANGNRTHLLGVDITGDEWVAFQVQESISGALRRMFGIAMTPQRPSITATAPPAEEGGERIDAGKIFVDRGPVSGVVLSGTAVSYGGMWTFTFDSSLRVECPRWEYVQCGEMKIQCDIPARPPLPAIQQTLGPFMLRPDSATSASDPSHENQFDALNGIVMVHAATIDDPWDHDQLNQCIGGRVLIEWRMRTYIVCKHDDGTEVIGYIAWTQRVVFTKLGSSREETEKNEIIVRLNPDDDGNPQPLTFHPTDGFGDPEYDECVDGNEGW